MRAGGLVLLAAVVCALGAVAARSADRDTGRLRPPAALSDDKKAIWMGEWVACRRVRLSKLAKVIGVKIPSGRLPQVAATLIAKKAEAPLWMAEEELAVAIDGCRNGILWRYYRES
jgi:hypothetical protein